MNRVTKREYIVKLEVAAGRPGAFLDWAHGR